MKLDAELVVIPYHKSSAIAGQLEEHEIREFRRPREFRVEIMPHSSRLVLKQQAQGG